MNGIVGQNLEREKKYKLIFQGVQKYLIFKVRYFFKSIEIAPKFVATSTIVED